MVQQQSASSSGWHAASCNGMSRTNSAPDNFGSSTNSEQAQQPVAAPTRFTVTTGDIVMISTSVEDAAPMQTLVIFIC